MSVEQDRFLPLDEITHSETEIVLAPPATANELLNTTIAEPENLSLARAPLHIATIQQNPQTREYLIIPDNSLTQRKLFNFLRRVSPSKNSPNIPGVIADWEMPDMQGAENRRLQNLHGVKLGDDWVNFEKHRKILLDVLRIRDHVLQDFFLQTDNANQNMLVEIVRRKRSPDSPSRLVIGFVFPKHDGGENIIYAREIRRRDTQQVLSGEFRFENYYAQAEYITKKGESMRYRIIPESVRFKHFLLPVVRWQKTETFSNIEKPKIERKWALDFIDERNSMYAVAKPILEKHAIPETENLDIKRLNPLAGLLLVAYYSPEIIENWPDKIGFGGDFKQTMGPAQIPVLALMKKNELLQTEFIRAVEKYAEEKIKV